jgi:hypothetical protein
VPALNLVMIRPTHAAVDSTRAEGAEPINAIFGIRPLPMVLEVKTVVKRG